MEQQASKAKIKKWVFQYGLSFLIMVAIVYFTFAILLKQYAWHEIKHSLAFTNIPLFILAFALIFVHQSCLASNLKMLLARFSGVKIPFGVAFQSVMLGFYFNNITPSTSGGQPMQIYYLFRRGIHIAHSCLVFIAMSFYYYIAMYIYTGLTFIFDYNRVMASLGYMHYFLIIGLIINIGIGLFCYFVVYQPQCLRFVAKGVLWLLLKSKLFRHPMRLKRAVAKFLKNYADDSSSIKKDFKVAIRMLLTCLLQVGSLFSIPFAVCVALGAKASLSFFLRSFGLQSVLYMSTSALPTPGAVGITESGFITMFESVLPKEMVMPAMILTRIINLYGFLLIAACFTLWAFTFSIRKPLKQPK